MTISAPWNTTCRECKSTKAYQGLNDCECPTRWCTNFSEKQKQLVEEEEERQRLADDEYLYKGKALVSAEADEDYSEYYKTMSKLMANPFLQGMPIIGVGGSATNGTKNQGHQSHSTTQPSVADDNQQLLGPDAYEVDDDLSKSSLTTKNNSNEHSDDSNYDYYEYDDYHVD